MTSAFDISITMIPNRNINPLGQGSHTECAKFRPVYVYQIRSGNNKYSKLASVHTAINECKCGKRGMPGC